MTVGSDQNDKIRQWLSPPDAWYNLNLAVGLRHIGTGAWFFEDELFKEWQAEGSMLWIHGKRKFYVPSSRHHVNLDAPIAGSGKSVLL